MAPVADVEHGPAKESPGPWPLAMIRGALAILTLTLTLACVSGLIGSDDLQYAAYAQALQDGSYMELVSGGRVRQHALRYAVIAPVAAVYKVFGVSEWTTIVVPLVAATLSVLLLVEVGRRLFGLRAGIIAGLLYATFPLHLILGTVLLPELIAECYVLAGVLCYLRARDRGGALWIASGLLMGAGYLAKETALFIGGAFLLHAMWERQWRGAILFALGVAFVGAVEHAYYALALGNLNFRSQSTQLYTLTPSADFFAPIRRNMTDLLFVRYPRMMLIPHLKFGLHSLACIVLAASALLLRPRRSYALVLLWIAIPALYLNFGSWSFQRYAPLPRDERYIEFLYPPLMLLSAVAISRALAARAAVAATVSAAVVLVLVVGVGSGFAMRGEIGHGREMTVLRELVRTAQETPGRTIYTDNDKWRRALMLFDASILSHSPDAATFILSSNALGLPTIERSTGSEAH